MALKYISPAGYQTADFLPPPITSYAPDPRIGQVARRRTMYTGRLSAPIRIFPPDPPDYQTQMRVRVTCVAHERRRWNRRYPQPQGWEGQITRGQGPLATSTAGARNPNLGPRPPLVIDPLPNQRQQTITVACVAVGERTRWGRRYPLPGWRHRATRLTVYPNAVFPLRDPFLGPRPPQIVGPPPLQQQMTLAVTYVSIGERRRWNRRYPLQGWRQRATRLTVYPNAVYPLFDPVLGPRPPQIVGPPPTQQQQTIATRLVALTDRLKTRNRTVDYKLSPPTVVLAASLPTRPAPTFARIRPRPVRYGLGAPQAVTPQGPFPGPSVHLCVNNVRRRMRYWLGGPQAVTVNSDAYSGPEVRLAVPVPRQKLKPRFFLPTVIVPLARVFQGPLTKIVRTRPRPTKYSLGPPQAVNVAPLAPPIGVHSVVLRAARPRPTTRFLRPPTVLQVFRGPLVSLVRTRPRRINSELRPPTTLASPAVFSGPAVKVVRTRPRPTKASLAPPQAVNLVPIAPPVAVRCVAVSRAARPRPTDSRLRPPAVTAVSAIFSAPSVEGIRTRPRPTHPRLRPPVVVGPVAVYPGPSVKTTRTRPRPTKYSLAPPQAVDLVPLARPIQTHLVRTRPRPTTTVLGPGAPPSAPVVFRAIQTHLVSDRPNRVKREPFSKILIPAVILYPVRPPVRPLQLLQVAVRYARDRRRVWHQRLYPPRRIFSDDGQITITPEPIGTLPLVPEAEGTLGLTPSSHSTKTLTPESEGTLTLTPDDGGSTTLTPDQPHQHPTDEIDSPAVWADDQT